MTHEITAADLDFAGRVASRTARQLPPIFELEDLWQTAKLELLRAAAAYDPARGASFRTYAAYRIRGAVLMAARRRNWTEAHHDQLGDDHEGIVSASDIDAILDRARVIRIILQIASRLDNPHRYVFRRRYVDGALPKRVASQCHWTLPRLAAVEAEAILAIRSRLAQLGITREVAL